MKKYKYIFIITILLGISLCACSNNNPDESLVFPSDMPHNEMQDSSESIVSGKVVISFGYEKISGWASNQFAVWFENTDGNYIKTLYATRWTADNGWKTRPESIPLWAEKSGLAFMSQSEVNAVAGATPRTSGNLSYTWDLTDTDGNAVLPGEYKFFVEGSLRWSNRVIYSGIIEIGKMSAATEADVEFIFEASPNGERLNNDSPEVSMIGAVTANYFPDADN